MSHNNMATFFSGTDTGTLVQEGTDRNHFVSLIVNNAGTYTAAITRRIKQEIKAKAHVVYTTSTHYNTWNDADIKLKENEITEKDIEETKVIQYIEWYELNINKEVSDNDFSEVDARLSEIKKDKAAKAAKSHTLPTNSQYSRYPQYPYQRGIWDDDYPYPSYEDYKKRYEQGNNNSQGNQANNLGQQERRIGYPTSSKELDKIGNERIGDKEEEYDEMPLCMTETYDNDLLNLLLSKLLTGDILSDVINYDEWLKDMDKRYETFFGPFDGTIHTDVDEETLKANRKNLTDWIENMVDILVYVRDEDLIDKLSIENNEEITEADTAEVCAAGLINKLKALPDSYVKDIMIDQLLSYIPYGFEEIIGNSKAE